jgi:hypothetical protein
MTATCSKAGHIQGEEAASLQLPPNPPPPQIKIKKKKQILQTRQHKTFYVIYTLSEISL